MRVPSDGLYLRPFALAQFVLIPGTAMMVQMFKSKIHRAVVTQANLNYVGSITTD